jgi:hypothetical protein
MAVVMAACKGVVVLVRAVIQGKVVQDSHLVVE